MLRRTTLAGRVWLFGVAVIAIALVAAAAWGHNGLSGPAAAWAQEGTTDPITVLLGAENNSGQSGKMTLTTQDADTKVILTLPQDSGQSKLAHIHFGQCPSSELGNTVFGLANIDATGTSITLLEDVSIAELLTGNLAVNTHDAEDSTIATACGSIPAKANPTRGRCGYQLVKLGRYRGLLP